MKFALHYKLGDQVHWLAIQCEEKPSQEALKKALKNNSIGIIDIKELSNSEYTLFMGATTSKQKELVQKWFYANTIIINLEKTGGGTTERVYK